MFCVILSVEKVGEHMKKFNTAGLCVPNKHYMVDTTNKINKIVELIKDEAYFAINRSRQYGKTTTIYLLKNRLKNEYEIINISFEGVGDEPFTSNGNFVKTFIDLCAGKIPFTNIGPDDEHIWCDKSDFDEEKPFSWLSKKITAICQKYQIIVMIDEMDKCSDNQVFLNFLGMLREKYLSRNAGEDFTFKSVILASVYDVKNLKLKLRPDEERKYNSPWNIAVDFDVDMSFQPKEIATMLLDYEKDAHTGMDIEAISRELYHYTNGYPYLVSWLCKWIDEQGEKKWSHEGIKKAGKALLKLRTPLFDDLIKNVEHYKGLREKLSQILTSGEDVFFSLYDNDIAIASMFGIVKEDNGKAVISNILFESCLYDYFGSQWSGKKMVGAGEKSQFIKENGHLDIIRVLHRFQALMKAEYRKEDQGFLESHGRLLFLCFLKSIINGVGFYYVEPQTRTNNRMDIVVSYLEEEFIIELKIWHGEQYHKEGIRQLNNYLESREQTHGYLVSFSFRKNKEYTVGYLSDVLKEQVPGIENKKIYEVIV